MRPPIRSPLLHLALAAITIAAGLLIRFAPLGLPSVASKYGGSFLWAIMVYWLLAALLPRLGIGALASVAVAVTTGIEFFKLVRTPSLDAFRLTLPGILLLGRFFSVTDILVYWLAILTAALIDRSLPRHRQSSRA